MNYSNIFVLLFFIGVVFDFVLHQILEYIDFRNRKVHGMETGEDLKPYFDEAKLAQTVSYENAKYFLWIPRNITNTLVQVVLVMTGFYVMFFNVLWNWTGSVFLTAFIFQLVASMVFSSVVDLPFKIWGEFKIEKRFGFSNMTLGLMVKDGIKSFVLEVIITALLSGVECVLILYCNSWWWLLLGVFYVVFSLVANIIYPMFIAPLFNKFTPVEGELKERLEGLMARTGFKADGIFTMDASKRSNHSNAYFTGMGKSKRIVLYDTLVKQMDSSEIESVMGHELGHYKKHHIIKRMIVMIPLSFIVLYVVSFLVRYPSLYEGFGFTPQTAADFKGEVVALPYIQFLGLWLLGLIAEGYSSILSLVSNFFSRRNEYEADSFAVEVTGSAEPLVSALIKLNKENLSEIQPPSVYVLFNYSHPPLRCRIENARKVENLNKGNTLKG